MELAQNLATLLAEKVISGIVHLIATLLTEKVISGTLWDATYTVEPL